MTKRIVQQTIAILFLGGVVAPASFAGSAEADTPTSALRGPERPGLASGPDSAVMLDSESDDSDSRKSCESGPCGLMVKTSCKVENARTAECQCVKDMIIGSKADCEATCPKGEELLCQGKGGWMCNPRNPTPQDGTCACTCVRLFPE